MRLTDEYKRITEQFKDLQSKFRHFEQVDTKKYAEVRLATSWMVGGQCPLGTMSSAPGATS
jgi:hypothetical protein